MVLVGWFGWFGWFACLLAWSVAPVTSPRKALAIEEAWAQKARFAGKLRPSRSIALKQNRTHDMRFDDQPKHVQETRRLTRDASF